MDAPLDIHFITTLIKEDAGLAAVREKVLENDDPSHGYDHVLRVALWTVRLKPDSCDIREAIAAALLHDAVTLPKNHQQRELASILSAERAEPILLDANFSSEAIERIKAAVRQYTCIENTSPTKNLAQALHDEPAIADRIRIYYIGSSNTTADPASRDYVYQFMQETAPHLWWIENGILPRLQYDTFRGVYLGGIQSGEWGGRAYVEHTIRGRGTTHDGKFTEKTGDAMPLARHPGSGDMILKEGDTPSFLYLLSPASR